MSEETDAAYAAGLIDGEGAIAILKIAAGFNRRKTDGYQLTVRIAMTDYDTIEWYRQFAGGEIRTKYARTFTSNDSYEVVRTGYNATRVLTRILPYLITKKSRAELGIKFRQETEQPRNIRGNSPELVKLREEFFQQMKTLNIRGPSRVWE